MDEVAEHLGQMLDAPVASSTAWCEERCGKTMQTLMITEGEAAVRALEIQALGELCAGSGVVAIHGSVIEDARALSLLAGLQRQGTRIVKCQADLSDIAKRLGLNQPRAVAFGPVRMQVATFIRQRDDATAQLVPDVIVDTSKADWKKQIGA